MTKIYIYIWILAWRKENLETICKQLKNNLILNKGTQYYNNFFRFFKKLLKKVNIKNISRLSNKNIKSSNNIYDQLSVTQYLRIHLLFEIKFEIISNLISKQISNRNQ